MGGREETWSENDLNNSAWNMLLNFCQPQFHGLPDALREDERR